MANWRMIVTPEQDEFWGLTESEPVFEGVLQAALAEDADRG